MLVAIMFLSSITSCSQTCIDNSKLTPTVNITLIDINGNPVTIAITSAPLLSTGMCIDYLIINECTVHIFSLNNSDLFKW
jgi:hypothetical protein